MATNERAVKGEKNKKTTDDPIAGKEKSKDRRETSLPKQSEPGKSGRTSNRDEPKSESQNRGKNDNQNKGKEKPKQKD